MTIPNAALHFVLNNTPLVLSIYPPVSLPSIWGNFMTPPLHGFVPPFPTNLSNIVDTPKIQGLSFAPASVPHMVTPVVTSEIE